MGTCKTCFWWNREYPGCCGAVDTIQTEKPDTLFSISAYGPDDTWLETYLRTGPDFGCIHHKES